MASINGINLPDDFIWVDEFTSTQVAQVMSRALTGALIVQSALKVSGRPMTLDGTDGVWVPRSVVDQLRTLFETNPDGTFTLEYRGETFSVIQDVSDGSCMKATPVIDYSNPQADALYSLHLKLLISI